MKAQKVDDVNFTIEEGDADLRFNMVEKDGSLYLSLSNLFFKSDDKWYEIPVERLQDIEIISKDPPELSFSLPSMKIEVKGDYAEKLLALRHLLLPYMDEGKKESEPLLDILKLKALGIQKPKAIADIVKFDVEEVEVFLKKAEEEGLLKDGKITAKGKEALDERGNGKYLDKLEA